MKQLLFLLTLFSISLNLFAQQDTVFIKYRTHLSADTHSYETDTVIFPSATTRHMLMGTTVLPWTHNQQNAKGYGLYFEKVTKSECQSQGIEVVEGSEKINSIIATDSSLTVDVNIYDNCCYDFLCDIAVDSSGTLSLLYQGYGSYCACNCCFGLTFHIKKINFRGYGEVKAVMLGEDRRTLKSVP